MITIAKYHNLLSDKHAFNAITVAVDYSQQTLDKLLYSELSLNQA